MRDILIFLAMMLCLFGPMALFTILGRKSLDTLGKRPTDSARVMTALIIKLIVAAIVVIGILMALLKFFG